MTERNTTFDNEIQQSRLCILTDSSFFRKHFTVTNSCNHVYKWPQQPINSSTVRPPINGPHYKDEERKINGRTTYQHHKIP